MTNCIFYSLFFALFLNLSFGSLRISQVNRVFMSIYKGMIEASVVTINDQGEPIMPYYSQTTLNSYVDDYLKTNISKYVKDYTLNTKYLEDSLYNVCDENCRVVSINLKAKINVFYEYDRTQTFAIRSAEDE